MSKSDLKERIRPIYSELQGYLSQAPQAEKPHDVISDISFWKQFNETVKELSENTGKDYSKFLIEPEGGFESRHSLIRINTYRQKLSGIISRIYGEFFSDELAPFSGMPSTIITQTQQQNQSVQMYLDIQNKINEVLNEVEEISNDEKSFLENFKSKLGTASNINEILKLCFQLAKEYRIGIATLLKFFG